MKEYRATPKYPFHTSCGGVIIKKGKILLLHRFITEKRTYDSWHLPKGTKLVGETNKQTVERECLEETGYEVKVLRKIGSLKSDYNLNDDTVAHKITHYYLCRPAKRKTKEIIEHDEIKWVEISLAKKLLADFKLWEHEEKILQKLL